MLRQAWQQQPIYMEIDDSDSDNDGDMEAEEECDSCECEIEKYRLRQSLPNLQDLGVCWFFSILHVLYLSEGLKKAIARIRKNLPVVTIPRSGIDAYSELEQLSDNICTNDIAVLNKINTYCSNIFSVGKGPDKVLYQEFFGPKGSQFCTASTTTGGDPINYILPYMVKLGFNPDRIKCIVSNFQFISNLYNSTRHPRSIKYLRVLSDYLKLIIRKNVNPRGKKEVTDVLIFLTHQYMNYHPKNNPYPSILNFDKAEHRNLFLGSYIIYFVSVSSDGVTKKLYMYVYKLDAMTFFTINDAVRKRGHVICAVTCGENQYIVNSYDSSIKSFPNDCGIMKYNWKRWENKNEFYTYTFENGHEGVIKCQGSLQPIRTEDHISITANRNQDVFLHHRNIGNNAFIYVFDEILLFFHTPTDECNPEKELPKKITITDIYEYYLCNFQGIMHFTEYAMPYFVYFTYYVLQKFKQSVFIKATPQYTGKVIPPNMKMISPGIYDFLLDFNTCHCFYMTFAPMNRTGILKFFLEVMPEDFIVFEKNKNAQENDKIEVYFFVEFTTDTDTNTSYGGSDKPKRRSDKPKRQSKKAA